MYLQIESASRPCSASSPPRYGDAEAMSEGVGTVYSARAIGSLCFIGTDPRDSYSFIYLN